MKQTPACAMGAGEAERAAMAPAWVAWRAQSASLGGVRLMPAGFAIATRATIGACVVARMAPTWRSNDRRRYGG